MNSWLAPSVIASLLSTIVLTACYGYLFRKEREPELRLFFFAWLLYSFRFIFRLVSIKFPTYPVFTNIIYILTLLNGALLFIGSRRLLGKRSRRYINLALLSSWLIVPIECLLGFSGVVSTTIVFVFAGIIYILVGVNFVKKQNIHRGLKYFIGIIFILWGLHKFDYPFFYDSLEFAPLGYIFGAVFSITSALCILMLYYESQKTALLRQTKELMNSKKDLQNVNYDLKTTKERLKIKIDYILNPEREDGQILNLTDVLNIEVLQRIQDSFADAVDVAALITDHNGNPITKPSNFSEVCNIIRSTETGKRTCMLSDMAIGAKSAELLKPVLEECQSCGFIDAAAPIMIGDKHVANWMIGQANLGNNTAEKLKEYALSIGADSEKIIQSFEGMKNIEIDKFEKILNLLWIFSQEISAYAYNNILLAKKLEEDKLIQTELIKQKKRAEENDRLKDAFLSNISHEIRTPLNGILGFSELLSYNEFSKDETITFSRMIRKSGKRLLNTIDDIINISVIQTGQLEINMTKFNLSEMVERIVNIYEPTVADKGLCIDFEIEQTLEITSDQGKIEVILIKLIDNAIKFTNEGRIHINSSETDGMITISINDTGIGIVKEKQLGAFNAFEQGEFNYNRNYEGLGLGLSIARAYSDALGGRITIESLSGTLKKDGFESRVSLIIPSQSADCLSH